MTTATTCRQPVLCQSAQDARTDLAPSTRWLALQVEYLDDGADLGDVKADVKRAVLDVIRCSELLLVELGSDVQVRVGHRVK